MDSILNTLSTREKSLIIWVLFVGMFIFLKRDIRKQAVNIFKLMFLSKLAFVFVGTLIYTLIMVYFLNKIHLWDLLLIKDTAFWLLGSAFILLMSIDKVTRDVSHIKKILLSIFALSFVLEYVVNLYTFNFWLEIILVPIFVLIGGMLAIAGSKQEYKQVKNLLNYILILFGTFSIIYAITKLVTNFQDFATLYNLRAFLIEPILTIGYIPFLYLFALIMVYESLYVRIKMFTKSDKSLVSYTKWEIFKLCHFNLAKLIKFSQNTGVEISRISNKKDVSRMISNYKGKAN